MFNLFRKKKPDARHSLPPPPPQAQSPAPRDSAARAATPAAPAAAPYVSRLDPARSSSTDRTLNDSSGLGTVSMSFMDEMLDTLDFKLSTDSTAPTNPASAASNKYPALRSTAVSGNTPNASQFRQTQLIPTSSSTTTTNYSSMEDDILAAFDMIQVLDKPAGSTSDSGFVATAPYSSYQTPSRTFSTPSGSGGGLSTTPYSSKSSSTIAKAYNIATRTSSPAPYSPSSNKPDGVSSRYNSEPHKVSPSPLPPASSKFNRTQRANLQKEFEQNAEQVRREKEEQEQARKIELAKALYFKDNLASSSASISSAHAPQPLVKQNSLRSASRNSRVPAPVSGTDDRGLGGGNRAGQNLPVRSMSAMGAPVGRNGMKSAMAVGVLGNSTRSTREYSSESEDSDVSDDNKALASMLARPNSMMERSSTGGMGPRSLSALNVSNWLKGQQQQQYVDPSSNTGKSVGRRSHTTKSGHQQQFPQTPPESPNRSSFGLLRRSSQTRSLSSTSGTIQEQPAVPVATSSPAIGKRASSMSATSILQATSPTVGVSSTSRVKSPLTPNQKKPVGTANAATVQQLYQSNQVKKLGETQQSQQQAQNAMMTYLAQMAVVQQTQMAALLAQQQQAQLQQLQQQQQFSNGMGVVVGMAPALTGTPVSMGVASGAPEEKKKKRKGRMNAPLDDAVTVTSGSTGSGGESASAVINEEAAAE
ncbi:hypothetical protein BDR26DRAFT_862985 [Obelidium mucronatum]|nr:hypothetical protein BDR26DRAFT_862985 [Obelidium mucronatum]